MKDSMRTMARPYAILFAIALVVAVLARIGLAVMDAAGWLAYDYISASGVPMLDVICSILTGSAFVAFYEKLARETGRLCLRMDTNARNTPARALYAKLGYAEVGVVEGVFNGIPGVRLVCLEKGLEAR